MHTDSPQLSDALFTDVVLEATNKGLAGRGWHLERTDVAKLAQEGMELASSHTGAMLVLRGESAPDLVILAHSNNKPTPDARFVRTMPLTSGDPAQARAALRTIADAEDAAHAAMGHTHRPNWGAVTYAEQPVPTHLKGRLAIAPWRQDAGTLDGPIPPARPVQAVAIDTAIDVRGPDGRITAYPKGAWVTRDLDGNTAYVQRDTRLADLAPTQTHPPELRRLAGVSVAVLEALRADPHPTGCAVAATQDGRAVVGWAREDGRVFTLGTFTGLEQARESLDNDPDRFVAKRARIEGMHATGKAIADGYRASEEAETQRRAERDGKTAKRGGDER